MRRVYIGPTGTYWASGWYSHHYLFRSTDRGDSWQRNYIINNQINAIWQSEDGSVVYIGFANASANSGVWVSTDSGETFTQVPEIAGHNIYSLFEYGGFVYAGGPSDYKLTTTGSFVKLVDWRIANGYIPEVWAMTNFNGDLIVASDANDAAAQGLFKVISDDSVTTLFSAGSFPSVTSSADKIVAGSVSAPDASYSSTYAGDETNLASGVGSPTGIPFQSLAYGGVFVGAGQTGVSGSEGLWYSADGINWTRSAVTSFARSVAYQDGVYLAAVTGGIYKSTDGINWVSCNPSCAPTLSGTVTDGSWGDYDPSTNSYPITLTANPSGGTGSYSYSWNSSSSINRTIELTVLAGATQSGTAAVTSGSQSVSLDWSVTAPAAPSGYPKHPVILIHGIGGKPSDWDKNGVLGYLLSNGYTSTQVKMFDYGINNGAYNYQGDIYDIGPRLQDYINDASSESVSLGGDGKVDVLGFSMGGVVGRQGLVASPSAAAKVRKFITVGSPNLGSYLASFFGYDNYNPSDSPVQGLLGYLRNELVSKVLQLFKGGEQPLSMNSPAAQELMVNSSFLNTLNSQTLPLSLHTYALYGNEKITFNQKLFFLDVHKELPLGDLVVDPSSGSTIPGSTPLTYLYQEQPQIDVHLARGAFAAEYNFVGNPNDMKYFHSNLLQQDDIRSKLLDILSTE